MGAGGAAGRFWDEFRGLYVAAGAPTLASLVSLAEQQLPPAQVSDTTLSEWLNGKGVPSRAELPCVPGAGGDTSDAGEGQGRL